MKRIITSIKKYRLIAEANKKKLALNSTKAEIIFRELLNTLGVKHQFQHIVYVQNGFFIADFTVTNKEGKRYLLEVDGGYHFTFKQRKKDEKRSSKIRTSGYGVLRLKNDDIYNNPIKVVKKLKRYKIID